RTPAGAALDGFDEEPGALERGPEAARGLPRGIGSRQEGQRGSGVVLQVVRQEEDQPAACQVQVQVATLLTRRPPSLGGSRSGCRCFEQVQRGPDVTHCSARSPRRARGNRRGRYAIIVKFPSALIEPGSAGAIRCS